MLGQSEHPEEEYMNRVLPDKIRLAKDYLQRSSLFFDLTLIFRILLKMFAHRASL